jgi:beta-phosphoglucomutase-like phosphatase (HAD superfamily)
MIGQPRAIVVAFDGLIADTLDQRTNAVVEGIAAVGFPIAPSDVRSLIAGHTIQETVRISCAMAGHTVDETLLDIAALRATRMLSTTMRQPVLLVPPATEWMQRARMHARLVVRADSERAHVEPVLSAGGLADIISILVCADDLPSTGTDIPMFVRAWKRIAERCQAIGVSDANVHGLECAYDVLNAPVAAGRIRVVTSVTDMQPDALQLF